MRRTWGLMIAIVAALAIVPATAGAATITPTFTTDEFDAAPDPNCSLREAIESAVTNAPFGGCPTGDDGTDTIVLTANLADPYNTTLGSNAEEGNAEGDFDVGAGGPIVISGQGDSVVSTSAPDRIFDLKTNADLTLENLIVSDGDVSSEVFGFNPGRGGNIRATGTNSLTLNNVIVSEGIARDGGGGIWAQGANQHLRINDSRILDNTDEGRGGGIYIQGNGSTRINRTLIEGNSVVSALGQPLTGGGIRAGVADGGELVIADTTISGNFVTHTGGDPTDQAHAGGISLTSQATIRRSLIADNTLASNVRERGGGIHVDGGDVGDVATVINSAIYRNLAGDPDAPGNNGEGGGVYENGDIDLVLRHVTMSTNSATDSGSGDQIQRGIAGSGEVRIGASIVTGGLFANPCDGSLISSAGFNVTGGFDTDCNFDPATDDDAGLVLDIVVPPADNGGSTETIALTAGSPAVDYVPAAVCGASEGQDQRGFFRPSGGACDAGAYERVICNGVVQEGPTAVDCPPPPPTVPIAAPPGAVASPCSNLKGKARKRCLCKQKKGKKRKKCLKRLKGRKRR